MNKKALAVLMPARMRPTNPSKLALSPLSKEANQIISNSQGKQSGQEGIRKLDASSKIERSFEHVQKSMYSAISMNKTDMDAELNEFSEGYLSLSYENRRKLLLILAKDCDLNGMQIRELIKQYLGLEPPNRGVQEEGLLSAFYHIEQNLRQALKPVYDVLFERLNTHPGGLRFLSILQADILSILTEENIASLRALDSYLKDKLSTWLSPAALELHQITWDDPASLLEKVVAYEAVHPISSLMILREGWELVIIVLDIFIQLFPEVLWDNPPIPECDATCALFYSISSTQSGLAGINLGKFLIKRVITLVKRDMLHITTFATLSPIPGFMQWLLSKLASQSKLAAGEDISNSSKDTYAVGPKDGNPRGGVNWILEKLMQF